MSRTKTCLVNVDHAQIYCETAGRGMPLVMIHAGVADSRQWNNEFSYFAGSYQVVRYDLRGYGKSEPVQGEYSHMQDLLAVLETLEIREPGVFMGCSMGGMLALDFALEHPERTKAVIMVGSGPSGLQLDMPDPPLSEQAAAAWKAGDLDRTAELETQLWFDGTGRTPDQVNPEMRKLAYQMDRLALAHESKGLGKKLPNSTKTANERLSEVKVPLLSIVGEHDVPYIHAATDVLLKEVPGARRVIIKDAGHLPNMDHPEEFREVVEEFLRSIA